MAGNVTRDATLLDIGAGVGAVHHELLGAGIARAVHVDASTAHLAAAREESTQRGYADRVDFVHGDFVSLATTIPSADVVTLDKVICCYPDMERLVRLAAEKAGRFWGAAYPRRAWWVSAGFGVANLLLRLRRSLFRTFLHDPDAIETVLASAGLDAVSSQRTLVWEVVVYRRRESREVIGTAAATG
jgi:magnesium-protoporphyrin O-methyltransferase